MSLLAQVIVLLKWRRTIRRLRRGRAALYSVLGLRGCSRHESIDRLRRSASGSDLKLWSCRVRPCGEPVRIKVPNDGNTWGPPVYVALLRSRALLVPIAIDSIAVSEGAVDHSR